METEEEGEETGVREEKEGIEETEEEGEETGVVREEIGAIGNLMGSGVREEIEAIEGVEAETVTTTMEVASSREVSVPEETDETEKAKKERNLSTSTRKQERLPPTRKTARKESSRKSKVSSLLFRTIYSH